MPLPRFFPSSPFGCPTPAPFAAACFSFFSTTPFGAFSPPPSLVVSHLRFIAAFFFFGGLGGSGLTFSASLELLVELELEEEEEGLGWRGPFFPFTPRSSSDSNLSRVGEAGGGLSSVLTAAGTRAALPAGVEVLPTSSNDTHGAAASASIPAGSAGPEGPRLGGSRGGGRGRQH